MGSSVVSTIWTHVGAPSKHRQANKSRRLAVKSILQRRADTGSNLLLPINVDLVPCISLAPQVCSRAARKAAPQQKCDTGNCLFLFSAALVECAISCDSVCSLDRRPSRAVTGCPVAEAAGLRSKA